MPDAARRGGPPDIMKVLTDVFEVPAGPFRSREDAERRVREAVRDAGVPEGARLFLSDDLVRRGALFDASGARVAFPEGDAYERCFVALVDPDPEARWGHPAYFVFVPAGADARTVLTSAHVDELDLEADEPSFLTPEVLSRALDGLPGVQALVIAACFAGVFLPLARPDRRLVLAACGATPYYGGGSIAWAGFPAELFRAWCGISPVKGAERPTRLGLDAAFDLAKQRVMDGAAGRVIEPHRAGSIHWPR